MRGSGAGSDLLMPRTDRGVLAQVATVTLVLLMALPWARRWRVMTLWAGSALLVAGVFAVRAVH